MKLYNATILTMNDNGEIIENGYVETDNEGRIADIGRACKPVEGDIDCKGDFLLPALVNGHTHNAMTLLRGYADDLVLKTWLEEHIFPAEGKYMNEEAVILGNELGMLEMLAGGTGTFCDMYFFTKSSVQTADKAGMRGLFAEGIIDFPTPNTKNPQDGFAYVKESLRQKTNISRIVISVHAPYTTSPDIIAEAAEIANKNGILFVTHTAETEWEVSEVMSRYGKTPVSHYADLIPKGTKSVMAHMVHLTEDDMHISAERGFGAVHNPQSNLKLSSGIAKVQEMIDKGINVGIGTDGAASNNNLDMIEEMRTAAMIGKTKSPVDMNAETVLRCGTIMGAKALGLEKETGSIEKGKSADIIRIHRNGIESYPFYNNPYSSIIYALNSRDVYMTMVNGKILYENGEYMTLNKDDILGRVIEWQKGKAG